MSDPYGWSAPNQPAEPGQPAASGQPAGQPMGYATYPTPPGQYPAPAYPVAADPYQNWGMAVAAGQYDLLVPRPPRPGVVTAAVGLVYAGIALSAAEYVLSNVYQWQHRDEVVLPADQNTPSGLDPEQLAQTSVMIGIVIGALIWLLVAAGVVVCAVFAMRGRNGARITLAALLGVLAVINLCSGLSNLGATMLASADNQLFAEVFNSAVLPPWWFAILPSILLVLCVTAAVMLLVPSANRYFSPGVGRRFAPGR